MQTQCNDLFFEFQTHNRKKVISNFNGGHITSDGGAILLRGLEKRKNILKRFADCFTDYRKEGAIEHSVQELISQRVYGIILGYEDLNDHDELRRDVLLSLLSGKKDPAGQDGHEAGEGRGGHHERNLLHDVLERRYKVHGEPPCSKRWTSFTQRIGQEALFCLTPGHL